MALVDDLLSQLSTAATNAATHKTSTQAKTMQATAAKDTPPSCLEGMNTLDAARREAELAHNEAGKAQEVLALMALPTILPPPTTAQLAAGATSRDIAVQAATDAEAAIAAAEPGVVAAHDACIMSRFIVPLIDCVNQGVAAANAATTSVADPLPGGKAAKLDEIVQRLIDAAAALTPTAGGSCNEGVQLLADAGKLIDQKTADAALDKLQGCLDNLAVTAPGNTVLTTGQTAIQAANDIINHARALTSAGGGGDQISKIWRKRIACSTPTASISVHVTDHSDSDMGKGVAISALNFPLSFLIPVELPPGVPPAPPAALPTTNNKGRVSISVPLAPQQIPTPAGTPPAPAGLAPGDVASLIFTAAHPDRPVGTHTSTASPAGLIGEVEVHIKIDDTSV